MSPTLGRIIAKVNDIATFSPGFIENMTNNFENTSTGSIFVSENIHGLSTVAKRITIIFRCVISFYLFAVALVYEWKKKKQHQLRITTFLTTVAAFAAFFSTSWQFAELWYCCVVSCKALRWIDTFCYIINSSFVYTIVWIHQRNLYSDPKLPESKQKCIKALNTAILVAIQLTIVVAAGALISRFRLIQTDFGCVYDRERIGWYRQLLPISITYVVANAFFHISLLLLTTYPLLKRGAGFTNYSAKIIQFKQLHRDIKNLIIRLAVSAFLALFVKTVIDILHLFEAIGEIDLFVLHLRGLESIVYSFLINFTFANWKQRLFPFKSWVNSQKYPKAGEHKDVPNCVDEK